MANLHGIKGHDEVLMGSEDGQPDTRDGVSDVLFVVVMGKEQHIGQDFDRAWWVLSGVSVHVLFI